LKHFRGQNLKFPRVFKSDRKNKKNEENGNFYKKPVFEKIDFGF